MRAIALLLSLVPALCIPSGFESKTWMYKGCRIHVVLGKREKSAIGTYLVTVVAPSGKRATIRADRDGTLVDAWASDLDRDGKFEVVVSTRSAGGGNYGKVGIFSWTGADLKRKSVPELNASQLKGYMGQDQFSVSRNSLYRSYPIFVQKSNDPARKTGMRTLRLNLKKFRWEAA
jgi:hypothetical protein